MRVSVRPVGLMIRPGGLGALGLGLPESLGVESDIEPGDSLGIADTVRHTSRNEN